MRYVIPISVLGVYLLVNLAVPRIFHGSMILIVDALLWTLIIVTTLWFSKLKGVRMWRIDGTLIQLSIVIGALQIFVPVFAGFFMGFGQNSNVWTLNSLAFYFTYLLATFLGVEVSRAHVATKTRKRGSTPSLLLITLLYTVVSIPLVRFTSLNTPLTIASFLSMHLIPALAINLFATCLANLGGATASITYMAVPAFFGWFSPILPDPSWSIISLAEVMAPTIGFLIIHKEIFPPPRMKPGRLTRAKESSTPKWIVMALFCVIAIWAATGLLGFTPSVIASGSMRPTMDVGDLAIVLQTPSDNIKTGDIIQYWQEGGMIIHRVVSIEQYNDGLAFITQGDANNAPDTKPIYSNQIVGKVISVIPKLGWVSIGIKTAIAKVYTFFSNNIILTYITLGTVAAAIVGALRIRANSPTRKRRGRFK